MLDFLKFKSTPLVGIDISPSSIKILELSRVNGQYWVESYGVERLTTESVNVAAGLQALIKRVGVNRNFAAIAVAGSSVLTRIIQVNAEWNDVEIEEQIEVEADHYIPYPLEETYYDFEVIGPSSKDPKQKEVLLAVSRLETVEDRVSVVSEAGLKTIIVDVETLAMERAFRLVAKNLDSKEIGTLIALVDMGATHTTFYVFQNLRVIYIREQAFGGKHLIDEIQKRYGISMEEAIKDYGVELLVEPFKEAIVQQIHRALQVFFSSRETSEIHSMVLAGGVAELAGLKDLIEKRITIKTFIADLFSEMQFSKKINKNDLIIAGPSLMMACGLALRNFEDE